MECTLENILPHVYGLDEKRLAARLSLYLAVSDGAQIAYSGGHGASVGLQQNVSLRAVDGGGSHRQEATVHVQLEQKLVATWRNAPLKVPVNRQAVAIGTARVVGTEQSQVFARNALSATGLERAVIDALRCQAAQHGSQSLERQRAVTAPYRAAIDFFRLD